MKFNFLFIIYLSNLKKSIVYNKQEIKRTLSLKEIQLFYVDDIYKINWRQYNKNTI